MPTIRRLEADSQRQMSKGNFGSIPVVAFSGLCPSRLSPALGLFFLCGQ